MISNRSGQFELDYLVALSFFIMCIVFVYFYSLNVSSLSYSDKAYMACAVSEVIVNYLHEGCEPNSINETKLETILTNPNVFYEVVNSYDVNLTVRDLSGNLVGCIGEEFPSSDVGYCERLVFNSSNVYILEVRVW
ncbi:DUF7287 family protein [Archaeoglobus profundus]|uniref:Uncharacterized protein n=1 Tax=Archaeoglobus profundus (strain DSM 5631 / JCM 9629 / NBRC 100127 / Av18) TaxID=572546 RepID=D2RHK3_ARCPA|nr:hypothetical protein [Archaeoglobus profundus]ADB57778.1 hypothetical protein Arcpr_0714 [Archaeoglobus profundus DSM 5631]